MGALEVLGQLQQHLAQTPTLLTSFNHSGVKLVKLTRMLRQRLGQRCTGVDLGANLRHQVALCGGGSFFTQSAQSAFQRQTSTHQAGELTGPHHHIGATENTC